MVKKVSWKQVLLFSTISRFSEQWTDWPFWRWNSCSNCLSNWTSLEMVDHFPQNHAKGRCKVWRIFCCTYKGKSRSINCESNMIRQCHCKMKSCLWDFLWKKWGKLRQVEDVWRRLTFCGQKAAHGKRVPNRLPKQVMFTINRSRSVLLFVKTQVVASLGTLKQMTITIVHTEWDNHAHT